MRTLVRVRAALVSLALAQLSWGCAGPAPQVAADRAEPAAPAATDPLPRGAVEVEEDLFQLPIGVDADGCMLFQLYSPTRTVTLTISYRSNDGGFTFKRRHALCRGEI